jgi:hypothetical protein
MAVAPAATSSTRAHPRLGIDRLDTACARAALAKTPVVTEKL